MPRKEEGRENLPNLSDMFPVTRQPMSIPKKKIVCLKDHSRSLEQTRLKSSSMFEFAVSSLVKFHSLQACDSFTKHWSLALVTLDVHLKSVRVWHSFVLG